MVDNHNDPFREFNNMEIPEDLFFTDEDLEFLLQEEPIEDEEPEPDED